MFHSRSFLKIEIVLNKVIKVKCFFTPTMMLFVLVGVFACAEMKTDKQTVISASTVAQVVSTLTKMNPETAYVAAKGVKQTAALWQSKDGSEDEFAAFCEKYYFANPEDRRQNFLKISEYLEAIWGRFNEMTLQLTRNVNEATGELLPIDELFAAFSPDSHLGDDLYANKLAFIIKLNFPTLTLEEKNSLNDDRLLWAYARLGDVFKYNVPARAKQTASKAAADADVYVAAYNIFAGRLLNYDNSASLFPNDMCLLAHWNLRDEIKANYHKGDEGLAKQRTICQVMKRIISQEIPVEVINSQEYNWNPFTNELFRDGKQVKATPENTRRYETMLNIFNAQCAIDSFTHNTFIDRNFAEEMEVAVDDAETMLRSYLAAPEMKAIANTIAKRLGRPLQSFDIWYDGFKPRSTFNEDSLSQLTRQLYPNAEALNKDLPTILNKLGFKMTRAEEIASKVVVDAARGSGHAWGAAYKGQHAHLRTRIADNGLDYKGFNIAIHEFGHNVEQTISLYNVDYYMLNGVPNTAFTEALAFVFQQKDLEILGVTNSNPDKEKDDVLDKAWNLFEISGVSLLDILVWHWLYAHPDATPQMLKETVIRLSKEVWNMYYAPVIGVSDETLLAIYSHSLSYPLYLPAYAYGHIIQFQLETYLKGKDFAQEVDRIFRLGKLTPARWMQQATGEPLSAAPLLNELRTVVGD